jgi:N6-adenosine-specific RNA methylase IME4
VKFHALADLFPLLEGDELDALAADIKTRGLLHPIVLYEEKILDGRNRWNACRAAKVEPRTETYRGKDPVGYVISANLHRRHLNESQRAMVADKLATMGRGGDRRSEDFKGSIDPLKTQEEAASLLNVSVPSVKRARIVRESGIPALAVAVDQGKVKVSDAASVARLPAKVQERALADVEKGKAATLRVAVQRNEKPVPVVTPGFPDGPFRTLVIDPPWPIEKIVLDRRPVEDEPMSYPTLSLDEIKALPVARLADARGAHVYLWVTHRFLPVGLELFAAWGVRYECVLTWIKPTAQPLWWMFNTEHVLFGKVASLAPLVKGEKVGFTAPQQRHSHKPEEFFDLVRRVSPEPRLTMFDDAREGFERWGISHTPTP